VSYLHADLLVRSCVEVQKVVEWHWRGCHIASCEGGQKIVVLKRGEQRQRRVMNACLQVWAEAARCGSKRGSDSTLAAAAMYVLQVTQGNALWASEHDTAFIRCLNILARCDKFSP